MEEYFKLVTYILGGIYGLCVGSFLNVVIYRLPLGMRLDKPRSHCPHCGYTLRMRDNIPVFSYLFLRGRCHSCKTRISPRYTAVELLNMLLWLLAVDLFYERSFLFACVVALAASVMISVFFIDLAHMIIPDSLVIALLLCGLVGMFFDPEYAWYSHLIGLFVGFLFFYGIYALFYYGFHKEALGGGDIKLAAAAGLLLGWERLLLGLILSSVSAAVILAVISRRSGAERDREYPFGPFLTVGFLLALYVGAPIIRAYLGLLFR